MDRGTGCALMRDKVREGQASKHFFISISRTIVEARGESRIDRDTEQKSQQKMAKAEAKGWGPKGTRGDLDGSSGGIG